MVRLWRDGGRDVRLFGLACLLSFLGDGFRYAALPLLAVRLGAGPGDLGALLALATLPFLLVGLTGGALVDRVSRRAVLLACDGVRLLAVAGFVLVVAGGVVSMPYVYAFAFLMGAAETVATSASFALLPALVPDELLVRANTVVTTALTAGRQLVGPLLGALLIGVAAALPFVVDGLTFLASLLLIAAIRHRQAARQETAPRSLLSDVRDGVRWMRGTPYVLTLALAAAAVNFVHIGALGQQPYLAAVLRRPDTGYGLMLTFAAAGGILAAPLSRRVAERTAMARAVSLGLVLIGGGYLLVASAAVAYQAYVGTALTGAGFAVWNVAAVTWRQRVTPDGMRGRADALNRFVAWGVLPLGSLAGGILAARLTVRVPFVLAGAVPLLLVVAFLRVRPLPATVAAANRETD